MMPTHQWKAVPLCGDQLRDVRPASNKVCSESSRLSNVV